MANLNEFIQRHIGKYCDFDGAYGYQCVDLVKFWNKELGYGPRYGNGKDWINNAGTDYTRVDYKPGLIPQEGDIFSFRGTPSNPAGHTGIVVSGDSQGFTSFDQNWSARPPAIIRHDYSLMLGWIRPKKGVNEVVTDDILLGLYNGILMRNYPDLGTFRAKDPAAFSKLGRPVIDVIQELSNSPERAQVNKKYFGS